MLTEVGKFGENYNKELENIKKNRISQNWIMQ